jgi:multidrug efflux pump subunit AcrA (membrane-fusion protein)
VRTEEPIVAPKRSKAPLVVVALLFLAVLGVLFRPVDATLAIPCELQVDELGVPRAPRAGPVGKPEVAAGALVEKGAVLARLTLAADESPEAVEAAIKAAEAKLAASHPPASAKDVAKAQATLKKATATVAALTKKRKKTPKKQLAAFEKKLAEKQAELEAAKQAIDVLQQPDERAELKRSLEKLTSKKVAAAVQAERSVITAPATGLFIPPETAPEKLAENDGYGRIIAPSFRAVTKTALVTDADTAVFDAPAGRIDVKLEHGAAGVTARVDGQLKWVGAKGTLEVAAGRTPWLLSALR